MLETFSHSWLPFIVLFGVPALIAGYFAMRRSAGPLTDAMREMQEDGEDAGGMDAGRKNKETDR